MILRSMCCAVRMGLPVCHGAVALSSDGAVSWCHGVVSWCGVMVPLTARPRRSPRSRHLASFLSNFAKKPFTVNEQIKLIHDFLRVRGGRCPFSISDRSPASFLPHLMLPCHRGTVAPCTMLRYVALRCVARHRVAVALLRAALIPPSSSPRKWSCANHGSRRVQRNSRMRWKRWRSW